MADVATGSGPADRETLGKPIQADKTLVASCSGHAVNEGPAESTNLDQQIVLELCDVLETDPSGDVAPVGPGDKVLATFCFDSVKECPDEYTLLLQKFELEANETLLLLGATHWIFHNAAVEIPSVVETCAKFYQA